MKEVTNFSQSIHGFRLMKYLSYLISIPSLFILIYLIFLDEYNKKNENKRQINKKIVGGLTILSVLCFIFNFGILCIRLFNQKLTGEFDIFTLFSIFFSSVLIFANMYYLIHINDKDGFMINFDVEKSDIYFNSKSYLNYLYYSIYTLFTQGYGDIYPRKVYTRLLSCLQMLISYILTAYVFSKIIANSERVN